MKELHNNCLNPDLSHYKTVKLFSIDEAGLLTCGIDPIYYEYNENNNINFVLMQKKPINWQHALMLIRSIVEGMCTHEIKSPSIKIIEENGFNIFFVPKEQAKISIDDIPNISTKHTLIHRDELYKWLWNNGYFAPSKEVINIVHEQDHQKQTSMLLPESTYTTPSLEALQGVINEFWVNYDPNGNQPPPKQDTVASWIKANYPDVQAQDMRTYIDKICRHPTARAGGNRKRNP